MRIIETPTFTRQISALLPDDDYRLVQAHLAANPQVGEVIPGGGGIRKFRFARPGMGKRGGGRLIYYWQNDVGVIFMLLAYAKGRQENLTGEQLAELRSLAKELNHEAKHLR
ncbi:type II toxin-antitoxin system RelE/ParE family toxin [Geoalkalibacter sp.]|uniref:type II toxin-antitoxin system RelE/ParE family toxin n=1 Tax=Geoalkalibacter sp. TaxID=3041440 RepID=UPI00272E5E98|nr:type II toxin-antitoxin system RelE/ParE family toxin [Geoalkalibacter sp.]